jgi:hypothetical protein
MRALACASLGGASGGRTALAAHLIRARRSSAARSEASVSLEGGDAPVEGAKLGGLMVRDDLFEEGSELVLFRVEVVAQSPELVMVRGEVFAEDTELTTVRAELADDEGQPIVGRAEPFIHVAAKIVELAPCRSVLNGLGHGLELALDLFESDCVAPRAVSVASRGGAPSRLLRLF